MSKKKFQHDGLIFQLFLGFFGVAWIELFDSAWQFIYQGEIRKGIVVILFYMAPIVLCFFKFLDAWFKPKKEKDNV